MKKITKTSIRESISTAIAPKGTKWIGQIGNDYSYDQTDVHRTATAAAIEIAAIYNADPGNEGKEVRVVLMEIDEDGCADECLEEIVIREGICY